MNKTYNLRSDTFTLPSEGMRKAIYEAEVGDDVYREDPTVRKLEEMSAELSGKESALFVSSGSMGNLIPLILKGGLGKEVITAKESHIVRHEIGAVASISRTLINIAKSERGILNPESVESLIHEKAYDSSEASIIEVENTTSGLIYPLETMKELKRIAEKHDLWVHLDGARIFNAVVKTKILLSSWAKEADDVTFCLSKGLGAPMGSVLASTREFIDEARRIRKILGGGLRQSGFMAAAGIYALEHNVERLEEDDQNRISISRAIEDTDLFDIDISETNMIFFKARYNRKKSLEAFINRGILVLEEGDDIRAVTSLNITKKDAEEIAELIRGIKKEEVK